MRHQRQHDELNGDLDEVGCAAGDGVQRDRRRPPVRGRSSGALPGATTALIAVQCRRPPAAPFGYATARQSRVNNQLAARLALSCHSRMFLMNRRSNIQERRAAASDERRFRRRRAERGLFAELRRCARSAEEIRVFAHLARDKDLDAWREAKAAGRLVGINDETPYGYGRAERMGCRVEFSRSRRETLVETGLRLCAACGPRLRPRSRLAAA